MKKALFFLSFFLFPVMQLFSPAHTGMAAAAVEEPSLRETIESLSSFDSRTTGSPGYEQAAAFIEKRLKSIGLEPHSYLYDLPLRRFFGAELSFNDKRVPLVAFTNNAVTPEATDGTISAPLFYVGKGELTELDGKNIRGSIVLIDFDSGRNWQKPASLGAKAAIFLQDKNSEERFFYTEKEELTPLQFPCFWMKRDQAIQLFGPLLNQQKPLIPKVDLRSRCVWENYQAKNLYSIIEGTDPRLKKELLIIEAFFDDEEFVSGDSPGADAAISIATFLKIAKSLVKDAPQRSVLLIATSGQAQTLAGMAGCNLEYRCQIKGSAS